MTVAAVISTLFWIAALTLAIGLFRRAILWSKGRSAPVDWLQLFFIPKRYFIDLHHVVARDPYIARTHIATAGGAIAAVLLVALNYGFGLQSTVLDKLIVIASAIMLAGTVFVWLRRRARPSRLSGGAWDRLPYTLFSFGLGLGLLVFAGFGALPVLIAATASVLLFLGSAELALGIGTGGPMKHAVAGLLHLAFHPRPDRFLGKRSTALKPLALERGEFGAGKPADFEWNRLLAFDACVQCGKCENACPAFAAGQPLNPKKLIQDLVCGFTGTSDSHYAGSPYPGRSLGQHSGEVGAPIVPRLIEADTLWSCTTCRACVEECPMLIEHVDAIVDMRRNLNLVHGEVPGKVADVLANLRETGTQGGFDRKQRYNWARDLDVPAAVPGKAVDVLLIAGEHAFDMRYQRSLRALIKLLKAAKVDFAVFDNEYDTGDAARRLGDEATFQNLAERNITTLRQLSFRCIITADPHVLHSLKNEYVVFGGRYEVMHHTTFLWSLVGERKLRFVKARGPSAVTYHDPCYLGRYNGEFDAPRELLREVGLSVREMQRHGRTSRCCGGGGGAALSDIPGMARIPDQRIGDARETGAQVVAVACPQCTAMLEGVTGSRPEVLDIAEILADALERTA